LGLISREISREERAGQVFTEGRYAAAAHRRFRSSHSGHPELLLNRGEVGVVRSTWFAPLLAYEVEFHHPGLDHATRALLMAEQVQVEDGSLFPQSATN
jgi:hypothetical protein